MFNSSEKKKHKRWHHDTGTASDSQFKRQRHDDYRPAAPPTVEQLSVSLDQQILFSCFVLEQEKKL